MGLAPETNDGADILCATEAFPKAAPIECHRDLRAFFHETLTRVLTTRRMTAPPLTECYLVAMLATLGAGPNVGTSLIELRVEAESGPRALRLDRLRALGDHALSRASLFDAQRERSGVSRSYVVDLGSQAYRGASLLASSSGRPAERTRAAVFFDLGEHFDRYTEVLEDVREETSLGGTNDVLTLYERYLRTGSPVLLSRLTSRGVLHVSPTPTEDDA